MSNIPGSRPMGQWSGRTAGRYLCTLRWLTVTFDSRSGPSVRKQSSYSGQLCGSARDKHAIPIADVAQEIMRRPLPTQSLSKCSARVRLIIRTNLLHHLMPTLPYIRGRAVKVHSTLCTSLVKKVWEWRSPECGEVGRHNFSLNQK
jgi:hypothetical protein